MEGIYNMWSLMGITDELKLWKLLLNLSSLAHSRLLPKCSTTYKAYWATATFSSIHSTNSRYWVGLIFSQKTQTCPKFSLWLKKLPKPKTNFTILPYHIGSFPPGFSSGPTGVDPERVLSLNSGCLPQCAVCCWDQVWWLFISCWLGCGNWQLRIVHQSVQMS